MNHANRFFKEVKRLEDAERAVEFGRPFGKSLVIDGISIHSKFSHECAPEKCFKRDDGLWETYPESYGRQTRKFVFIWRYHPNYCCRGRPIYTPGDVAEFLCESETEKVLYTYDGYELVWAWYEVDMPTPIIWGMRPGRKVFVLRKDGEVLAKTSVKKHFNEQVRQKVVDKRPVVCL